MPIFSPSLANGKKKGGIYLFRTGRKARASGCWGCALTIPQHRPTYSPGQKCGCRQLGRRSGWQPCPCHAQVSRALLSASGGHAKPPSAPSLFPRSRIARDAAKPLLPSGAASSRGTSGLACARQALPGDERAHAASPPLSPLFLPLLSLSLPKARPLSLPERRGPARLDFLPGITRTR